MPVFIQNKQLENKNLVPEGEYTARVKEIKLVGQNSDTLLIRFQLTTPGFEESIVGGFVGAHWRPSTRTSANLRQWCINLGIEVVSGHEEDIDLETLIGRECRVLIQGYTAKTGEQRCKVSNALPKEKRLATSKPLSTGLYISAKAPVAETKPSEEATPVVAEKPVPTVSTSSDDLW